MQTIEEIQVSQIYANQNNRTCFAGIEDLAASIAKHGLIQPITVKPDANGRYSIIAGERRFRAHLHLARETIDCIVRHDLSLADSYLVTLAENDGRQETNDLDKANGYHKAINELGFTIEDLARAIGKRQDYIERRLALLELRSDITKMVSNGQLSIGYASAMVDLDRDRQQMAMLSLRDNTTPTVSWFRSICNELLSQQNQQTMTFGLFGDGSDMVIPDAIKAVKPPDPAGYHPIFEPSTIAHDLDGQLETWRQAYNDWQSLGKVNKAKQCQAIVTTLQSIAEVLPALAPIETKPADRIHNLIRDHGSLTTRAIYQLGNINKADWQVIKAGLVADGRIIETKAGRGYRYSVAS